MGVRLVFTSIVWVGLISYRSTWNEEMKVTFDATETEFGLLARALLLPCVPRLKAGGGFARIPLVSDL